jgi:hypothetical protein
MGSKFKRGSSRANTIPVMGSLATGARPPSSNAFFQGQMRHAVKMTIWALGFALFCCIAACTAPVAGLAGLTVNGGGQFVVVLDGCGHTLTNVVLMGRHQGSSGWFIAGNWNYSGTASGVQQLVVDGTNSKWSTTTPFDGLSDDSLYLLWGSRADGQNTLGTAELEFRRSDLRQLRPGRILVGNHGLNTPRLLSEGDFSGLACRT